MGDKTERFIVRISQEMEELVYHDVTKMKEAHGRGPLKMMDNSLVPEADMALIGSTRGMEVKDAAPVVEPHKHDVSQLYVILGDLTFEVILEDERHEVTGPACIFIPAGMTHAPRPLRGNGYFITVIRGPKYE